jgi:hypothetical protein
MKPLAAMDDHELVDWARDWRMNDLVALELCNRIERLHCELEAKDADVAQQINTALFPPYA